MSGHVIPISAGYRSSQDVFEQHVKGSKIAWKNGSPPRFTLTEKGTGYAQQSAGMGRCQRRNASFGERKASPDSPSVLLKSTFNWALAAGIALSLMCWYGIIYGAMCVRHLWR